jgi:PAS domain S-box-containing protein
MSLILVSSIAIRAMALSWSIVLLWRSRDWRLGFLSAMIALMAVRQTLTLLKTPDPFSISLRANIDELPGLAVSILAFLGLIFLERMIRENRRDNLQLQENQQRLQKSETSLAEAQRIANVGSWHWDIAGDQLTWTDQVYRIYGLDPQATSPGYPAFLETVHPDDRALVEQRMRRAIRERRSYSFDHRIVRCDGEIRLIREQGETFFDEFGSATHMSGTIRDITEEKRVERELSRQSATLQAVLDNIDQGISMVDERLVGVATNKRFFELMGFPEERFPPNTPFEEYIRHNAEKGEYGPGDIEEMIRERVELARRFEPHRIERSRPDGTVLEIRGNPVPGGGFVTSYTDITDRKRVEMAMRDAKEQAEVANRTKSEFLANMSHELRTPLNAIIGFSEVMRQGIYGPLGSPKYEEYAQHIVSSGQHLLDVINGILDLSKIEAGKFELDEQLVDLGEAVETCISIVRGRAEDSNLTFERLLPEPLPALYADASKFKQIILNLLSNAVKFCHSGGQITIEAGFEHENGMVVRISDTGIGMSSDEIEVAMMPFGQVDSSLARKYEGTGLGLPLTKMLVELHGGRLELESETGVGTTVNIRFPAGRVRDKVA